MPLHLCAFYRKNKNPSRDFLSYWGVEKMNAHLALAFAITKIRANKVGAPQKKL